MMQREEKSGVNKKAEEKNGGENIGEWEEEEEEEEDCERKGMTKMKLREPC